MAITKRKITRTGKDGKKYTRTVWRSRLVDPEKPGSASAKIEKLFDTRAAAVEYETAQRASIASGSYISTKSGAKLLREVADDWKATWDAKPLSPRTQTGYRSLLDNHVLPRWGDVKVGAIDSKGIQTWINGLAKSHHAETVHKIYTVLRQVMRTAVVHRLIAVNPANKDAITLPSIRAANATKEQLALTATQARQLVNAMPEHWRPATRVASWCGPRAAELWGLRRQDVDVLHSRITIVFTLGDDNGKQIVGPTKGKARRTLDVPKHVMDDLKALLDSPGVRVRRVARGKTHPGGYPAIVNEGGKDVVGWVDDPADGRRLLFTTVSGAPVHHRNFMDRVFEPTRDKLWSETRLSKLRWHDLRHTTASIALNGTGNLTMVSRYLGHSTIVLTADLYSHMLPDGTKSLADALERIYNEADAASNVKELAGAAS